MPGLTRRKGVEMRAAGRQIHAAELLSEDVQKYAQTQNEIVESHTDAIKEKAVYLVKILEKKMRF